MSEHYPVQTRPPRGAAAFAEIGETHSPSQAAILLSLGRQLRGDDDALLARARASSLTRRAGGVRAAADPSFPVPRLKASRQPLASREVTRRAARRYRFKGRLSWDTKERAYRDGGEALFSSPTVDAAAELMQMCLDHPHDLVRIAAAHAYLPLTDDSGRCVDILATGVRSQDRLERQLATTALARVQPDHPALRRLSRPPVRPRRVRRKPDTLMLVHGTWASTAAWYRPGGDFHTFVEGLRPDLYDSADYFRWSGSYSDGGRNQGAQSLAQWVADHNESGLDLMGHSHGANVMMHATKFGMRAGRLILLSCPVHVNKYLPDFTRVRRPVVSVRVRFDLVILADGGGQRFTHPDIAENVLRVWFDHGATHDPAVWQEHDVATRIAL